MYILSAQESELLHDLNTHLDLLCNCRGNFYDFAHHRNVFQYGTSLAQSLCDDVHTAYNSEMGGEREKLLPEVRKKQFDRAINTTECC